MMAVGTEKFGLVVRMDFVVDFRSNPLTPALPKRRTAPKGGEGEREQIFSVFE